MADSLFSAAASVGRSKGKYRGSMYDVASFDTKKKYSSLIAEEKLSQFNETIGTISDTLSLASQAAGMYESKKGQISVLESEYGEMEKPETIFGKMFQSAKIGLGSGDYKFGEETISAKDFATASKKIEYQNMLEEVMKSITPPPDVKRPKVDIPSSGVGSYEMEDFEKQWKMENLDFDDYGKLMEAARYDDAIIKAKRMKAAGYKLPPTPMGIE